MLHKPELKNSDSLTRIYGVKYSIRQEMFGISHMECSFNNSSAIYIKMKNLFT